ncbi:MAG: glycosyltransferase [Actinomycetaceae bacterium]|nr:glycosyltransferase [Actinomycetaceae bacterium]
MRILIVIDDYFNGGNGMSISTRRFVTEFRRLGHEVRVLASHAGGEPDYPLPIATVPLVAGLIAEQGFNFARPVDSVIDAAVSWADIVHVETPFPVCAQAAKAARAQGKPVTGTFHVYPENMTASVPILEQGIVNDAMLRYFYRSVYRYCQVIQCPTEHVEKRLAAAGYKTTLQTISNGIPREAIAKSVAQNTPSEGPHTILSVGRFAREKDQETLIRAIPLTRDPQRIRLVLAGHGPLESHYKALADKHGVNLSTAFFAQEELRAQIDKTDLYVHCARVEVEGMSCMEAFARGVVPVISDGGLSATSSYAMTQSNTYTVGEVAELAHRIDYWLDRPQERLKVGLRYLAMAKDLSIGVSAARVLTMMEVAVLNSRRSHVEGKAS